MARPHYNVAPRYTPGSPGLVDELLAHRVASEEESAYKQAQEGAWGEHEAIRAKSMGLEGIVEKRVEFGKGWHVEDLITGKKFDRLDLAALKVRRGDTIIYLEDISRAKLQGRHRVLEVLVNGKEIIFETATNVTGLGDRQMRVVVNRSQTVRLEREQQGP